MSFWVTPKAFFKSEGLSRSGELSPNCLKHCASADPPRRLHPPERSMWKRSPEFPDDGLFKSGVTTCLISGQGAYVDTTRVPTTQQTVTF